MSQPLDVSVVMSVHNGSASLRATMDSVLSQQDVSFEFVIVNDGSTDESRTLLAAYSQRDRRVRVLDQENSGLTRSLIRGCASARAPYIARIDCGDRARPGRLAKQFRFMRENPECVFVSCWTKVVCEKGFVLSVQKGSGVATRPIRILDKSTTWGIVDGPSHHSSVMFRKDAYNAVGGYRAAFYYGQDWDLWTRLAEVGSFFVLPEVLCEAEASASSISGSSRSIQSLYAEQSRRALFLRMDGKSDQEAVEAAARIPRPRPSASERRKNLSRGHYFIGRMLAQRGEKYGRYHLLQAARLDPLFLRAWLALALSIVPRASPQNDKR